VSGHALLLRRKELSKVLLRDVLDSDSKSSQAPMVGQESENQNEGG
jgi:hypothetical protein